MTGHWAVDWFNGAPLDQTVGPAYAIHSHHVFPQALLYRSGYNAENHVHKQLVNEIANRAFLTGSSNWSLSDRSPADYLPEVDDEYPGALQKQFIPLDRALWNPERYEEFLQRRRELIAAAFNSQMEALLAELPTATEAPSVDGLIAAGESTSLEFKASLRWDTRLQHVDKNLVKQVTKTLAALANSDGGHLLIGINDDGTAYGIEDDVATLGRRDTDGFYQTLSNAVGTYLGEEFAQFVEATFPQHHGKTVCLVTVDASPKPVFHKADDEAEFFIRVGNTTRQLDALDAHEYIGLHWAI